MVEFSVILPAHNEAENLPDLIAELNSVMTQLQEPFEIIVVDDGSTDATCSTICALQQDTRTLRLLSLDHNRGQSAALDAGLLVAEGTFLITMDADGQNPPKEILKLYGSLGNHDAACGWRQNRKDSLWRRFCSKLANRIRRTVLQDGIHDIGCSLRIIRRSAWKKVNIRLFRGLHRFVPSLLVFANCDLIQVPVNHRQRRYGHSHYSARKRLISPLIDLMAVGWMKRRWPRYTCKEIFPDPPEKAESIPS